MSNFPNAAPPPGALFDNAPTVAPTWYARSDTSTLIPATRISQGRNGQWYTLDVLMQYGRPLSLDLALRRVAIGRTVFVAREDAGKVMEAVRGTDGEGS
jgi:hypothetical protein